MARSPELRECRENLCSIVENFKLRLGWVNESTEAFEWTPAQCVCNGSQNSVCLKTHCATLWNTFCCFRSWKSVWGPNPRTVPEGYFLNTSGWWGAQSSWLMNFRYRSHGTMIYHDESNWIDFLCFVTPGSVTPTTVSRALHRWCAVRHRFKRNELRKPVWEMSLFESLCLDFETIEMEVKRHGEMVVSSMFVCFSWQFLLEQWPKPLFFLDMRDYTALLYRDYNEPL